MGTQVTLLAQSLVLPLALSFGAVWAGAHRTRLLGLAVFTAWLLPAIWIAGLPSLPPAEAIQWIPWLGLLYAAYSVYDEPPVLVHAAVPTLMILLGTLAITWPVIVQGTTTAALIEIGLFCLAGLVLYYRQCHISPAMPALAMAISAGGLGIVTALDGSLLIGQLGGALAAAVAAFIPGELRRGKGRSPFVSKAICLAVLLNLWLLVVARVYVEIPFIVTVMLALSLLMGQVTRSRYGITGSIVGALGAILYTWATMEPGGYY